jgi:hypothetical protein
MGILRNLQRKKNFFKSEMVTTKAMSDVLGSWLVAFRREDVQLNIFSPSH